MRSTGQIEPGRSRLRRREVQGRFALLAGAVILGAGIVIFMQSRSHDQPGPTPLTHTVAQPPTYPEPTVKQGGTLPPAAKKVAARFVLTALARKNLAEAWDLVTPEFRAGVTRKQWLHGDLPVPPFPVTGLDATGFEVLGTTPNSILMQIFLVPDTTTGLAPTRYNMTLVRAGDSWKVSYSQPYAPPGVYAPPS